MASKSHGKVIADRVVNKRACVGHRVFPCVKAYIIQGYEVRKLIWTLFKNRSPFYHTIDLICTTRFASLPHITLL